MGEEIKKRGAGGELPLNQWLKQMRIARSFSQRRNLCHARMRGSPLHERGIEVHTAC
jgi:hypothetical protein